MRLGDGRWCPPFDVGPIDDAPPAAPCRYADLRAVIAVVHLGAPIAAHDLTFVGGGLVRHRLVTDGIDQLEYDVAVSLDWPSYLRWRCAEIGIAEAAGMTGSVVGPFPLLALGEGLVESKSFRQWFPVLADADHRAMAAHVASLPAPVDA